MTPGWRRGALALLAAVGVGVGASAGVQSAALPPAVAARLAVSLGTALVLGGQSVAVGSAPAAAAALRALGAHAPDLARVYPLPTLREGAHGDAVRLVQARLNGLGAHLTVDGIFGPDTLEALERFGRSHGEGDLRTVDGAAWRTLLGARVSAPGESLWALASLYDTSAASIAAWNPGVGGRSGWGAALRAAVWVMPPDVRPSRATLGSGTWAAPPASKAKPRTATTGASGKGARAPTPTAPRTVMVVLRVDRSASVAAIEGLAAWLGGRSLVATVALYPRALGTQAATALALEGQDVAVAVPAGSGEAALARAGAAAAEATGERPVVAYAGLYPSAAAAASAAAAGLALVAGGEPVAAGRAPVAGGVSVLSGAPAALERELATLVRRARRAGDHVAAVRTTLRLHAAD